MTRDLVRCVSHAVLNDLAVVRLLLDVAGEPDAHDDLASRVGHVGEVVQQLGLVMRDDDRAELRDVGEVVTEIDDLLDAVAGSAFSVRVEVPARPVPAQVCAAMLQRDLLGMVRAAAGSATPGTALVVRVLPDPAGPLVAVGVEGDLPAQPSRRDGAGLSGLVRYR